MCNRGLIPAAEATVDDLDVLCFPSALSIDRKGNLYVSDHSLEVNGNRRLLVFSAASIPHTNSETIFAPRAMKAFRIAATPPHNLWANPWTEDGAAIRQHDVTLAAAMWEPAFDSTNRMVAGYNVYVGPRFAGVYDDPLGPDTLPSAHLYDFGSMVMQPPSTTRTTSMWATSTVAGSSFTTSRSTILLLMRRRHPDPPQYHPRPSTP